MDAGHTFYTGTTSIAVDPGDPHTRMVKSRYLNQTIEPEEKRNIIGDTFMKVANELIDDLNLQPDDVYLGQGRLH